MGLSVRCECGREMPVHAGQAGTEITCSCGTTVRVPLLSELRHQAGEEDDALGLAEAVHAMMTDDPAPERTAPLRVRLVKILLGVFLVFTLIGLARLIIAYEVRRLQLGRVRAPEEEGEPSQHASAADLAKLRELARLYEESKQQSWQVIEPFNAYQAGEIHADELVRAVAKPAGSLVKKYVRMLEIAQSLEDQTEQRKVLIEFSTLVLLRHRGFTTMVEGIGEDDPAKIEAGRRLFEDARRDLLKLAIERLPQDSEEREMLRKLLEAYEASQVSRSPRPDTVVRIASS